jgi:hypothetical protein
VAASSALDGHGDERPLILAGDLNDTAQAATSQLLLGPPGSEIGTRGFDLPDQGDKMRLWNLAPIMPQGRDYSRINQGRTELIGHILVSQALVQPLNTVTAQAVIDAPSPRSTRPNPRRAATPPAPITPRRGHLRQPMNPTVTKGHGITVGRTAVAGPFPIL